MAVNEEDLKLQWFMWLGKAFCELCLIFGSISSPGIFDRLAKIVIEIVIWRSKIPRSLVSQHLDDCCAAAPAGDSTIYRFDNEYKAFADGNSTNYRFDNEYKAVALELGISLAPRDNPEKSFGPSTEGVIYGINYDTVAQSWWMEEHKLARIQEMIKNFMVNKEMKAREVWSLAGKINHVKDLVEGGKFYVVELLKANNVYNEKKDQNRMIAVSDMLKRELWWWNTMLLVCARRTKYPDPEATLPAWSLQAYTDAAGGSTLYLGSGTGAVLGCWWSYIPWSTYINGSGTAKGGKFVRRKLSALELVGPLLTVCGACDMVRGKPLKIFVDNQGSVDIFRKGYSTSCELSTTLARAIYQVSTALECRVELVKITRCSEPKATMADALSKGEWITFKNTAQQAGLEMQEEMGTVPDALQEWINKPEEDWYLGERIIQELKRNNTVIGY